MSALQKQQRFDKDFNLVVDLTEKPNKTNLKAQQDRAVVANIRADLVLPSDKILTVDIDFDTSSGYHDNAIMVMNDFGVELVATAFEVKYGKQQADKIRKAWQQKRQPDDPRKPTYILVQQPETKDAMPEVYAACGQHEHPPKDAPASIL